MACQHKKPCAGCPFRKDINRGALGGSDPTIYIGQSVGPFWLPCHMSQNYKGKQSEYSEVSQCAGAAIFRANTGVAPLMPEQLLSLPKDDGELVFNSHIEFLAHHGKMSIEDATKFLEERPQVYWMQIEFHKRQVRKIQ